MWRKTFKELFWHFDKMSEIEEVTYQDMHLLTMNKKAEMKNIAKDMGEMLMGTDKYIKENNIETTGMPLSVYHKWDKTSVLRMLDILLLRNMKVTVK